MYLIPQSEKDRFFNYVMPITESGCWVWIGTEAKDGYGSFWWRGTTLTTHRFSYMMHKGRIPSGMSVLHKCDIRCCVNPDHLFLGTHQENMDDMTKKGRKTGYWGTHCKRGHPRTEENTFKYLRKDGFLWRTCKVCMDDREKNRSRLTKETLQ